MASSPTPRLTPQKKALQAVKKQRQAQQAQGQGNKPSITVVSFVGLLLVAIFFDVLQALFGLFVFGIVTAVISIGVSLLTTIAAWLIFFVWFAIIGVSGDVQFFARSIATSMVSFLIELFGAGFVPTLSIGIVVLFFTSRSLEKLAKTTGSRA